MVEVVLPTHHVPEPTSPSEAHPLSMLTLCLPAEAHLACSFSLSNFYPP